MGASRLPNGDGTEAVRELTDFGDLQGKIAAGGADGNAVTNIVRLEDQVATRTGERSGEGHIRRSNGDIGISAGTGIDGIGDGESAAGDGDRSVHRGDSGRVHQPNGQGIRIDVSEGASVAGDAGGKRADIVCCLRIGHCFIGDELQTVGHDTAAGLVNPSAVRVGSAFGIRSHDDGQGATVGARNGTRGVLDIVTSLKREGPCAYASVGHIGRNGQIVGDAGAVAGLDDAAANAAQTSGPGDRPVQVRNRQPTRVSEIDATGSGVLRVQVGRLDLDRVATGADAVRGTEDQIGGSNIRADARVAARVAINDASARGELVGGPSLDGAGDCHIAGASGNEQGPTRDVRRFNVVNAESIGAPICVSRACADRD